MLDQTVCHFVNTFMTLNSNANPKLANNETLASEFTLSNPIVCDLYKILEKR